MVNNNNIEILSVEDPNYPNMLKRISGVPDKLYKLGGLADMNESCVAIVGTRKPTVNAIEVTQTLASKLVTAGFTVVSGLAAGIDEYAHKGTLASLGKTIAVLGTDVSTVYPSKNRWLAEKIQENGCLLSEHFLHASPSPRNLVQRNRIISGLSLATIVIQANQSGGTMHTARFAKNQDRYIFACQWSDNSEGTKILARDGAFTFTSDNLDDVVNHLIDLRQLEMF